MSRDETAVPAGMLHWGVTGRDALCGNTEGMFVADHESMHDALMASHTALYNACPCKTCGGTSRRESY